MTTWDTLKLQSDRHMQSNRKKMQDASHNRQYPPAPSMSTTPATIARTLLLTSMIEGYKMILREASAMPLMPAEE
jgi:hypothetical protein